MRPIFLLLPLLFPMAWVSQIAAQQQPIENTEQQDDNLPRLTLNAREVILDVVVLDAKGHSIQGLKAGDFNLVEGGVPQTVKSVGEHRAMSAGEVAGLPSDGPLATNEFTNFAPRGNTNSVTVILIDALDSPVTAQMYLRQQLISFMKAVPAGNTFAIFQIDNRMHLVQGFTSDPQVLLKAVESKRDPVVLRPNLDKASRQAIMHDGLQLMGRYLAAFSGRKNLIWFTGTIPHTVFRLNNNPFPDAVDFDNLKLGRANALSLSRIAVYPVDDRGLEAFRSHDYSHEHLEQIAEATGGKAYYNDNGLKQALAEIVQTGSNYYTLAYSPSDPVWRAHKRHVVLTVAGKRATLLYRHTYYARSGHKSYWRQEARKAAAASRQYVAESPTEGLGLPAVETLASPERQLMPSLELGTVTSGELLFHLSVTPATAAVKLERGEALPPDNFLRTDFRTKPFRNYELLYAVDPRNIDFTQSEDGVSHAALEFATVVYNSQGEVMNSLMTTHMIDLKEDDYHRMLDRQENVSVIQTISVPEKGNYFFRLGVHDLGSEQVGTVEIPVDTIVKGVAGPGQQLVTTSRLPPSQ